MKLAAIQAALVSAATGRGEPRPALSESLRPGGPASAGDRLAAYRANVRGTHLQALDQAYPVLREVLGPRYWRQLLEQEVPAFASAAPDLNGYGDFMPSLLRNVQERRPALRDLPYLEELARLEWQVHLARLAADDPVFDWQAFGNLSADMQAGTTLVCSHALALLNLDYPVDQIWRSHQGIDAGDDDGEEALFCCVHRAGRFDVGVTRLGREEFDMLRSLPGTRIGDLFGDTDALAKQIFGWIQRGWITRFEVLR